MPSTYLFLFVSLLYITKLNDAYLVPSDVINLVYPEKETLNKEIKSNDIENLDVNTPKDCVPIGGFVSVFNYRMFLYYLLNAFDDFFKTFLYYFIKMPLR